MQRILAFPLKQQKERQTLTPKGKALRRKVWQDRKKTGGASDAAFAGCTWRKRYGLFLMGRKRRVFCKGRRTKSLLWKGRLMAAE